MQKWTDYLILDVGQVFRFKVDGRIFSWRLILIRMGFVVD